MKRLNHKAKFKVIIGGLILFPFLAYMIAIGDTLGLIAQNSKLTSQLEQVDGLDERVQAAELQLVKVTGQLGMLDVKNRSFQQALLGEVSSFCENEGLAVVDFPAPIKRSEDDLYFETMEFTIQGGYASLVKLVNHLESEAKVGKLISADFEKIRLRTSRKEVLQLTLFIQNISRKT